MNFNYEDEEDAKLFYGFNDALRVIETLLLKEKDAVTNAREFLEKHVSEFIDLDEEVQESFLEREGPMDVDGVDLDESDTREYWEESIYRFFPDGEFVNIPNP